MKKAQGRQNLDVNLGLGGTGHEPGNDDNTCRGIVVGGGPVSGGGSDVGRSE